MAPKLTMSDTWWSRELGRIRHVVNFDVLSLFSDEAIDDMHSVVGSVYNMLTTEYRKRMGVMVDDVPQP